MKRIIIVIAAFVFAAAAQENVQEADKFADVTAVVDTAGFAVPVWETDVTVVESGDAHTVIILGAEPTDTQAVIIFEPIDERQAAASEGTASAPAPRRDPASAEFEASAVDESAGLSSRFSLFSVRSEFQGVFDEVTTAGLRLEFGMINENTGFFITGDFGGGANYHGVGLNVGYLLTDDIFRYAVGLSCGYHNTELVVDFMSESGRHITRRVGHNAALAGAFIKLMPWAANTLDITAKIMLGYKNDSARYDRAREMIYMEDGFTASWSISAGYVLLKRSEN